MKIGLCLPYMKEGLNRTDLLEWFQRVDNGNYHSISCGERIHGPTLDMRIILSAAAAITTRVEITPTLYVLPMHNATRVAKEVASLDVLSGGRVKQIVVGYGGREKDYEAAGARFKGRYGRMDRQIEHLRKVWAQHEIVAGGGPIGPTPTHPLGPKILAGAIGPKSIARCAHWADGFYAWSGNGELDELTRTFSQVDAAWESANRSAKPYKMGGFWYTLAPDGQQKLYDYVYNYLAIAGDEIATAMAQSVSRHTPDQVAEALDNAERAGCEEIFLVPATAELCEIDKLDEIIEKR